MFILALFISFISKYIYGVSKFSFCSFPSFTKLDLCFYARNNFFQTFTNQLAMEAWNFIENGYFLNEFDIFVFIFRSTDGKLAK